LRGAKEVFSRRKASKFVASTRVSVAKFGPNKFPIPCPYLRMPLIQLVKLALMVFAAIQARTLLRECQSMHPSPQNNGGRNSLTYPW